jgi:hypothetical protein
MKTATQAATESLWRNMALAANGDINAAMSVCLVAMHRDSPINLKRVALNKLASLGLELPQ